MTIDEFKAVLAIGDCEIYLRRYERSGRYCGFILELDSPLFKGHTEKAVIKKLKDWYYYEGRKRGNN